MSIIFYTTDLLATSKLSPVAAQLGATCAVANQRASLLEQISAGDTRVVVLDLNCVGTELSELVATLKSLPHAPAVIAFGPHVHEAKLQAAQAAGCDIVLTRGQFYAQAAAILRKVLIKREPNE